MIDYNIRPDVNEGRFGAIDGFGKDGISGWVIDMAQPTEPVTVQAFIGNQLVADGKTDIFRSDISDLLQKTVQCGFLINWKLLSQDELNAIASDGTVEIEIKVLDQVISCLIPVSINVIVSYIQSFLDEYEKNNKNKALTKLLTPSGLADKFESIIGKTPEPKAREASDVKLIAYYLPQFHPIPENDEWWGPGFTEWTNVAQAKPFFDDHYQPHVPGEFGFYDLRLPEVREAQAQLAREYGIYGFCYYYYWFEGRRLLERPLEEMFKSGKPDFPFCICWANENWSRRWDGSEHEILVEQVHNKKTDEDFIYDVIPLLKDHRYIKVNGAPILIIYRLSLMPNPAQTAEKWRTICAQSGIPAIHLCMAETFGLNEPRQFGFDSAVQFPPHNTVAALINETIDNLDKDFTGNIYEYADVIRNQLGKEAPAYKRFPGVMTSWDNTSRKKKAGNVFLNSNPENYEIWLRGAIDYSRSHLNDGERLVFINAWNEWAEGAHLEPDRKNGRAYLEATRRALGGQSSWQSVLEYSEQTPNISGKTKTNILADLKYSLERLTMVNDYLFGVLGQYGLPKYWSVMKPGLPNSVIGLEPHKTGIGKIEQLNHKMNPINFAFAESSQKLYITGWVFVQKLELSLETPSYLLLQNTKNQKTYYALIDCRQERNDVVSNFTSIEKSSTQFSGFKQLIDITQAPMGIYSISFLTRYDKQIVLTDFDLKVEIA